MASIITKPKEIIELNIDKYQALAYQRKPYGLKLLNLVDDKWLDWVEHVHDARWFDSNGNTNQPLTPKGNKVDVPKRYVSAANLALKIFIDTVWGLGVADLLHSKVTKSNAYVCFNGIVYCVPLQVYELDLWLEKLWQNILATQCTK